MQELLEFPEYTGRMEKNDGKCESDNEKKDGNLCLGRMHDSDCSSALMAVGRDSVYIDGTFVQHSGDSAEAFLRPEAQTEKAAL